MTPPPPAHNQPLFSLRSPPPIQSTHLTPPSVLTVGRSLGEIKYECSHGRCLDEIVWLYNILFIRPSLKGGLCMSAGQKKHDVVVVVVVVVSKLEIRDV